MALPLYRQIYLNLVEQIQQGILSPGDRVPSEHELARQFHVSRITSKKALEELAQDGIIVRIQGQGSFVREHLPDLSRVLAENADTTTAFNGATDSRLIGLILPDFADVYAARLIRAVDQRAAQLGYELLLRLTYGSAETEAEAITRFTKAGAAGLIVFPVAGEYYSKTLLRLTLDNFPLVVIDRTLKGIPAASVHTNNIRAAYELTSYLLDRGHQHIAFLSPPAENTSTIEERIQGFMQAFSHRGLSLSPDYCFTDLISTLPGSFNPSNIERDKRQLKAFISRYPHVTAFVASEYYVARVAHQTLLELGKRVPQDYAIVCFDSPENPLEPPLFTHIQQDEYAMGTIAVDVLDALIRGDSAEVRTVVDFNLIEGQSTRSESNEVR
jgi:GntR family transcriptional regulator of arabinose operon